MTTATLERPGRRADPALSSPPSGNEMLRITDLHAFYGESHVLHGMSWSPCWAATAPAAPPR